MSKSLRCKLTGCDLNPCGVCRRCGDISQAAHEWAEAPRQQPCYRREVCSRCEEERAQPDHDWEPVGEDLMCSRCKIKI